MPDFIAKAFDVNKAKQYQLFIQLSQVGAAYAVFDTLSQKYLLLKEFLFSRPAVSADELEVELNTLFEKEPLLELSYNQTLCILVSEKSTLIPFSFFEKSRLRTYLEAVTPLNDLDEIHYYYFKLLDAYNVYAIPNQVVSAITAKQRNTKFYNQSVPLIQTTFTRTQLTFADLRIEPYITNIAIYNAGKLLFHNSYLTSTAKDLLYFTTAVFKQNNLSFSTPMFVSGALTPEISELLVNYFPALEINIDKNLLLFAGDTARRYHNLLSLHQCE